VIYGRYVKKLSRKTQEAIGDMTKVCRLTYPYPDVTLALSHTSDRQHLNLSPLYVLYKHTQRHPTSEVTFAESLQVLTPVSERSHQFEKRIDAILELARKEAMASSAFYALTGWSGNVTLLCLLGYGNAPSSHLLFSR
jgi:hypothetical protein